MSKKQTQKQKQKYQEDVDAFTDKLYCLCREYCKVDFAEFVMTNRMIDTWGEKLWRELKEVEEVYERL